MPPAPTAVAVPLLPPLQLMGVVEVLAVKAEAGWVTMAVEVPVHAFLSVTVTVYVPAAKVVAVAATAPEDQA